MSESQRSQRWQRRKDARPAELLDAALAEFFEKGFEAARLEDIATRAGVSKGTIYLYFSSKEDIFQALVKGIPQANIERLSELAQDTSVPADMLLRRFLTLMGGLIRDERMKKFPRLLIAEAGRFPHLADIYREGVISRGAGILSSVIERGIAEGRFHPVNPMHAAYAAVTPVLFVAIWQTTFERLGDEPLDGESFINQHIDTFLRGICKGETQ
jgi:AcrR family transcriptional regulator